MVTENLGNKTVVRMIERVDSLTSRGVEVELQQLATAGNRNLICDFTATKYVSSAGLRVLLAATKLLKKEGGELRIVCPKTGYVHEVLEISGFTSIIPVHESVEEAAQHTP